MMMLMTRERGRRINNDDFSVGGGGEKEASWKTGGSRHHNKKALVFVTTGSHRGMKAGRTATYTHLTPAGPRAYSIFSLFSFHSRAFTGASKQDF